MFDGIDMQQIKTVKIKCFEPNAGKLATFEKLLIDTNKALDYYSQQIPIVGTNKTKLHHATYRYLRDVTNLPASIIQSTRDKSIETFKAYHSKKGKKSLPRFEKNKTIRLNNDAWKIIKTNNKFRYFTGIITRNDRIYVPLCGAYQYKYLDKIMNDEYDVGSAELIKKKNGWFLHITIKKDVEVPEPNITMMPIGIDLGIRNLAVTVSVNGVDFYSGKETTWRREFELEQRRKIGHKKVKHGIQTIKNRKHNIHEWMKDKNHKISRDIVNKIKEINNPLIIMEDITHIRKNIKKDMGKDFNRRVHSWAFRQLQEFIHYKANAEGVPVIYVDPKYTSQECPKCSNIDKRNRNGIYFKCKECGYQAHADYVGSINVQRKFTSAIGSSERASVDMPLTHTGHGDFAG